MSNHLTQPSVAHADKEKYVSSRGPQWRLLARAAVVVVIAMALPEPVMADLRCGTELIKTGDSSMRVLKACGEPVTGKPYSLDDGVWTYNFGPEEFMVRVVIIDGAVARFEQLDHGFSEVPEQVTPSEGY